MCCEPRKPVLHIEPTARAILDSSRELHCDGDVVFHCGTVMPDHIHFLFTLGDRLLLSQVIAKFKCITKKAILANDVAWQDNFFDHRVRVDVGLEQLARYIYLNPYRQGLIGLDEVWPWWVIHRDYRPEFFSLLRRGQYPQPEWIGALRSVSELIREDVDGA
jgi:putative transposase